uniref:Uncharacterized protein n=1 Tax=Nymphaea colorata TaxID=210225 RepID=A0A5K0Z7A6_9MAGN
MEKLKSSPI